MEGSESGSLTLVDGKGKELRGFGSHFTLSFRTEPLANLLSPASVSP